LATASVDPARSELWELIGADVAEAVLVEMTVRELMQSIDHVVVTSLERTVGAGRLENGQLEGAFQEKPALAIGKRDEAVQSRRCACGGWGEPHRDRTIWQVVGAQIAGELNVEVPDRLVGAAIALVALDANTG
jgi:hypothetical protein